MKKILYFLFVIPGVLFSQWVDIADRFYGDNNGDYFGWGTAINHEGDIIAISSYDDMAPTSGYVKVFQHIADDWLQVGETIPNEVNYSNGRYIDLNAAGTIVAVTSVNGGSNDTGVVHVYEFVNGVWQLMGDAINAPDNGGLTNSIALNAEGTIIAVGIPWADGTLNNIGETIVYKYNGSSWEQHGSILTGNYSNELFGFSLDLNAEGNILVVGSYNDNGFVKTFRYQNGDWQQLGQGLAGDEDDVHFGRKVSIDNSGTIIAGIAGNNTTINPIGYAKVYKLSNNSWVQKGNTIVQTEAHDVVGRSGLDLNGNGNVLAIGSPHNAGTTASWGGKITVFQCLDNVWEMVGEKIDGDVLASNFGNSLDLNSKGDVLVAGAPGYNYDPKSPPDAPGFVRVLSTGDIILNAPTHNLEAIVLYPNPTNGHFQINVNPEIVINATAVDALGREIDLVMDESAFNLTFDISNLQDGVFFIKLDTVDGVVVKPIVKN